MKNESIFDGEECKKDGRPLMAPLKEILPEKYHKEVESFVLDLKFNICAKKCPIEKIGNSIYIFCDNKDFVIILNPSEDIALKYEIFAWNDNRTSFQGGGAMFYRNGEEVKFDTAGDRNHYEEL